MIISITDPSKASTPTQGPSTTPHPTFTRRLRILLAHQPDEIRLIESTPVDLLVSGHTHGGQIALPFIGPLVTASNVPRHVAAGGLHELHETPVYVSTGVGRERSTAPQVRFGVRPSIGIIDITGDTRAISKS